MAPKTKNPKWHRDEIILALDLYFSPNRGSIDKSNKKVIELSKILNALPIFYHRPDAARFRNTNGVTLKLSNFLAFDPTYRGKGMRRGSKLDKIVFKEFYNQRQKLRRIAKEIKKAVENPLLRAKLSNIEDDEQTKTDSVLEGQILYKLHKVRERDTKISKEKKRQAQKRHGKLSCEVCQFEFESFYGDIGKGFIECHHKMPLAKFKVSTIIKLDDLALVCSNCHRMLHKKIDTISIEDLKGRIKHQGYQSLCGN